MNQIKAQCLCGGVSEKVTLRKGQQGVSVCHCDTCRYSSGLLCTSYFPVEDFPTSTDQLSRHGLSARTTAFFCKTCGCHVARSQQSQDGQLEWEVASGTVVDADAESGPLHEHHTHVQDTKDGGISPWIPSLRHYGGGDGPQMPAPPTGERNARSDDATVLLGSCLCGTVRFEVTRPGPESRQPSRGLPDLTHAYNTTSQEIMQNPDDVKWWIPGDGSRYLAGTCACRSCRQSSGFEIQTWAFVPRTNIFFLVPGTTGPGETARRRVPLDFATLPQGILRTHSSSPNVCRDFCGTCGASVFWREKGKPDVIDISAGLLRAAEGARAESWLDWWTDRVSFSEEVGVGRAGWPAATASALMQDLEKGLKAWQRH